MRGRPGAAGSGWASRSASSRLIAGEHRRPVGAEGAAPRRAPGGEVAERALEALDLVDPGVAAQVHRAVEHHRAGVLGERVRVLRPDLRPVGEAEVGQPLVADEGAQQVQVAHGVGGRDVLEQGAGAGQAVPAEPGDGGVADRRLGGVVGRAVQREQPVERRVVGAPDGRGTPDAAGSQLTRSQCSRPSVGKPASRSRPDPPGPPGLRNRLPSRGVAVARTRPATSVRARPSGADQSSGAATRAHSTRLAQRDQATACPV